MSQNMPAPKGVHIDLDETTGEFVRLGWILLEHKCRYYQFNNPSIADREYDILDIRYRKLAEQLGLPPSASDMVGFSLERHSCQQVFEKILREQSIQNAARLS